MGIGFVIVFFISMAAGADTPNYDDSIADIRKFFTEDSGKYLVGDFLGGVAFVLFFVSFAVGLRGVLGAGDQSGGMWARASLAGAILATALAGAAGLGVGAIALADVKDFDDSTPIRIRAHDGIGGDHYRAMVKP